MAPSPGQKSFHDILQHSQGFCVPPLQWTSRHLDLVGCRFEDIPTAPVTTDSTQTNPTSENSKEASSKKPNDAEILATNPVPLIKYQRLISILAGEEGGFAAPRYDDSLLGWDVSYNEMSDLHLHLGE